eukprot:COSAG06_NODE_1819_length_8293_cov_39.705394_9_plen_69_part_00
MFKFQAVLARTQPFLSRSVEKRATNPDSNAEEWSIIMQFAVPDAIGFENATVVLLEVRSRLLSAAAGG